MTGMGGDRESEGWHDETDEPLETERLALNDADDRLPWLESPDDEDYGESEGSDMGQTLRLGLMALAALAAIGLGIFWVINRSPDPALIPDGSLVAAEQQPYKQAPDDPGGKTFDGTGDTSFAVSEGQSTPAQMAAPTSAPPTPTAAASAGVDAKPAPAAPPPATAPAAAPTGGVGVQVGAFSSKGTAEAAWIKLTSAAGGALSGVSHRVVAGSADNGTIFRLQAVAPNAAAAHRLCGKLKGAGISCQVK